MTSTEKYLLMMKRRFRNEMIETLQRLQKDPATSFMVEAQLKEMIKKALLEELDVD